MALANSKNSQDNDMKYLLQDILRGFQKASFFKMGFIPTTMSEMFDRIGQQAHILLLLLTRVLDTAIKSQPESKSDPGPEDIKPNKTSRTGALSQGRDIIGPIHLISLVR